LVADPLLEVDFRMSDTGPAQSPDLTALLRSAAGGDEAAWRTLVALYSRRIFALAKSRFGKADVAEEITQSVFVTVAGKLGGLPPASGAYTEQGKFEPWLFRVAMNRIRDEARRARHRAASTDPASLTFHARPTPQDEPRDGAQLEALRAAIGRLSEPDREIIELRHHGQMSFKQMADVLDEPLGTLLARHHRALRKLKELMTRPDEPVQPAGQARSREVG
jgi:RNA polymerase sigma-70 factor (ECF subfamily)